MLEAGLRQDARPCNGAAAEVYPVVHKEPQGQYRRCKVAASWLVDWVQNVAPHRDMVWKHWGGFLLLTPVKKLMASEQLASQQHITRVNNTKTQFLWFKT